MEDMLYLALVLVFLAWIVFSLIWIVSSIKRKRFVKRWFFLGLTLFILIFVISSKLPEDTTVSAEKVSASDNVANTEEVAKPIEEKENADATTKPVVEEINIPNDLYGTWISDNEELIFWNDTVMSIIQFGDPVVYNSGFGLPWIIDKNNISLGYNQYTFSMLDKDSLILSTPSFETVYTKIDGAPDTINDLKNEFIYLLNGDSKIVFNGELSNQKTGNTMKVYYEDFGTVYYDGGWKNGSPNGPGKKYYIFGGIKEEGRYKDGSLDGKYKRFYNNGSIMEEGNYDSGSLDGKVINYYRTGTKESEYNYKNGDLHGRFITYYENGNKKVEAEYKNPLLDFGGVGIFGNGTVYYENGKVQYKGGIKDGEFDGKGTLYNEEGDVLYKGKWKNGEFIE